jgi:Flp pilus assembly protein TadB
VSPEVAGPALVVGSVLLLGFAVAGGERFGLLRRAGARARRPAGKGIAVRVRSMSSERVIAGRGMPRTAAPIVLGVAGAFVGVAIAGPPGAVCGLGAGLWIPRWHRRRRETRHGALLEEQLADAMDGIAAALRAGMSPSQAIAFACEEGAPPLADRLRAVVRRESLGMPLDESLEMFARQERSDDVRFAVAVLQLQHRIGGDAPAVLDDAVRTLRQRVAAAAELRSLTAQARLSGTILGLLPIGFFLFMSVVSKREVAGALASPVGLAAVVFGLFLDGGAFLWIRHLLRSEA